jgi:hypothetical protein
MAGVHVSDDIDALDVVVDFAPPTMPSSGPHCEACGIARTVMLAMEPGPNGAAWHLCSKCWVPGRVTRPVGERFRMPEREKKVKVTRAKVKAQKQR